MTATELDKALLTDLHKAYYQTRRNKRGTIGQLRFEIDLEANLIELCRQIQNRTYKPEQSTCFIIGHSVKREIFASGFRDKVVHQLLVNYIAPFFERRLIYDCYSCRRGFGTSKGIDRLEHSIRSASQNYTLPAYVLKLDLKDYFLSINKELLYSKIEKSLRSRKNRRDKRVGLELYLCKEILFHDPTKECRIKGRSRDWLGLPRSKSLFSRPEGFGLPLGNLSSQLFSNIYLNDFDHFIKRELGIKHYGRYVDDFYLVHRDKKVLLGALSKITAHLNENYGLIVHPKKIYLQPVEHGVNFLGAYLKPHRRYVTRRVVGAVYKSLLKHEEMLMKMGNKNDKKTLKYIQSRINSYFGYMARFKTFKLRAKLWDICTLQKEYFDCNWKLDRMRLKLSFSNTLYE